MIFVIILLGVFAVDLSIKKYIEAKVKKDESHECAGGYIKIQKLHNHGFAYGFLEDKPDFIKKSTFGILIASICYYIVLLFRKGKNLQKAGMSMILGGGICNFFDRIHQGFVTDYINLPKSPGKLKNTVFNLSDFFLLLGCVFVLIGSTISLIKKK